MEQLYLLEILIESIEIIQNDIPTSLVKHVKANVKCAKVINFTVEEKPETYEKSTDFNSGKSILFPMTKDKMLKLMKAEKISIDIMDIPKKQLLGSAKITWPVAFQSIVKDSQIKKKPITDQSSYDLTMKSAPAKKGGKITMLKVGTLKVYMVFNVFGKIVEVDFQLMNKGFNFEQLKDNRQDANSNVAIKKTSLKKELKAASEPWEPLFISAHNEKQSFIEPELRIFAELAGIVIGPSWADKLTPDFINSKLCGGKNCPGAVKFRDLGIGPLAQGTCLGSIGAVNKVKPEGVYGVSQAYGTMDDYGAFGLFVKDKKPIGKTCGSPKCPYAIKGPNDDIDTITDDGYQCRGRKPKELIVTNSVIDKYAHIKCPSSDCPFETANLRSKCTDPKCPFAKLQNSLAKIKSELHSITKFKDEIPMEKHQNSPCPSHESGMDSTMRKSCGCHNLLAHTKPGKNIPQCTNPSCCRRQSAGADREPNPRRPNPPKNEDCNIPSCPYASNQTSTPAPRRRSSQIADPNEADGTADSPPPKRFSQTVDSNVGVKSPGRTSQTVAEYRSLLSPNRHFEMPKLNDYSINDTSCDIPTCYYFTEKQGRSQLVYPSSSNQRRTSFPQTGTGHSGVPECPYAIQGASSYPSTSRSPPPPAPGQAKCGGPTCPYSTQSAYPSNQQRTDEANCAGQICPYPNQPSSSNQRRTSFPQTGTGQFGVPERSYANQGVSSYPSTSRNSPPPAPGQAKCGGPTCPYSTQSAYPSNQQGTDEANRAGQICPYPNQPSSSNQRRTSFPQTGTGQFGVPERSYANQGMSSYPSTSRSSPPPAPGQAKCGGPTCPYSTQSAYPSNQQGTEEANCGDQICPYSGQPSQRRASISANTCGPTCPCSCLDNAQPSPSQRRQSYSPTNLCGGPSCPYSQAEQARKDSVDQSGDQFNCEDQSCPYYLKQPSNLSNVTDSRRVSLQANRAGPMSSYTSTTNRCEDITCPSNQSQRFSKDMRSSFGENETLTYDSFSKHIASDYATAGSFNDSLWTIGKGKDHSKSMNNYLSYEDFMTAEMDDNKRTSRKHKEKTKRRTGPCEKETCKIMKYPTCSECGGVSRSGATCDNSKVSFSTISYDDVSCASPYMSKGDSAKKGAQNYAVEIESATKKNSVGIATKKRFRNQRFVHNVGETYPGFRVAHRTCYISTGPNVPWNMGWLWSTPAEPGLQKRKGWRPGVLGKTINERILARRRELGIPDPPELKMLGSRKKSKYPRYEQEEESEDEIDFNPKPTLTIQKKDGQYLITMHPLKDPKTLAENEYPYIKCAPMQFAIIKPKPDPESDDLKLKHEAICSAEDDEYYYQDCLCDEDKNIMELESLSSDSELNIEFTTPAGLIYPERLKRLPNVVHTDTQFKENDVNCSDCAIVVPNKYKKEKKKGRVRMR